MKLSVFMHPFSQKVKSKGVEFRKLIKKGV